MLSCRWTISFRSECSEWKKSYLSLGSFRNPSLQTLSDFNVFGHQRSPCWLKLVKRLILVAFRESRLRNDLYLWCHHEKFKIRIIFQFFLGVNIHLAKSGRKWVRSQWKRFLARPTHKWVKESHGVIRFLWFLGSFWYLCINSISWTILREGLENGFFCDICHSWGGGGLKCY